MKRKKIEIIISVLFGVVFFLEVAYILVYAYQTRHQPTGILSLFVLMLAFEVFLYFLYIYTRFKNIIYGIIFFINKLKTDDLPQFESTGYKALNKALKDAKSYFDNTVEKERLKKQILLNCIKIHNREKLLKNVMPLIINATNADACCYYLLNNITERLEIIESLGFGGKLYQRPDAKIGEGLEGLCCKGKITHVITNEADAEEYNSKSLYFKMNFKSVMAVPVCFEGKCIGVITLAYLGNIHKEDIVCAEEIAEYFAAAHNALAEYEEKQRQRDDYNIQSLLLKDITSELEAAKAEIDRLRNKNENIN